jgi:hypothetical protein
MVQDNFRVFTHVMKRATAEARWPSPTNADARANAARGTHTTTLMKRKDVMPPNTQSGIDVMTAERASAMSSNQARLGSVSARHPQPASPAPNQAPCDPGIARGESSNR